MDIEKEREAFEDNFRKTEIYRRECAIRGKDILEFSKTMGAYFNIVTNDAWNMWQAAKAQAVPEGFVLAPVEDVKTWYLDDDESIYREDPDWLCNTPVGEVVEVERRISYELDQAPVFAAITWDEDNQDVGYYETFATKDEAEKAAAHCKAMIEAQEQNQ